VPIRFPSHIQTPAERHDFLLRLQERLRRFNNARVRQIARAQGIEAARRWHRAWFRPRNLLVCRAIVGLRPALFPVLHRDEFTPPPWLARKVEVRALRDDASEMVEADPSLIETEDADPTVVDPIEDYTTYEVHDPNSRFNITANHIIITGLTIDEDAWVYSDKGSGHFSDFTHDFEFRRTSTDPGGAYVAWAVSNVVEDYWYWLINHSQALWFLPHAVDGFSEIGDGESGDWDTLSGSLGTVWHAARVERSAATLTLTIYTDLSRTTVLDTLTISVSASRTYRYVFAVNSNHIGNADAINGDVANLDLQEGGGPPPPTGVAPQFMHLARMRRA